MKFFFEEGSEEKTDSKEKEFFFTLEKAGVIAPAGQDTEKIVVNAKMKTEVCPLFTMEFGTYEENYAIHITGTNPKRTFSDERVFNSMFQFATILNEYVPPTLQVSLRKPRADWQMKVISAIVEGGATAWNFDKEKFETDGIAKMRAAIEKVLLQ